MFKGYSVTNAQGALVTDTATTPGNSECTPRGRLMQAPNALTRGCRGGAPAGSCDQSPRPLRRRPLRLAISSSRSQLWSTLT